MENIEKLFKAIRLGYKPTYYTVDDNIVIQIDNPEYESGIDTAPYVFVHVKAEADGL